METHPATRDHIQVVSKTFMLNSGLSPGIPNTPQTRKVFEQKTSTCRVLLEPQICCRPTDPTCKDLHAGVLIFLRRDRIKERER